MKLPLFIILTGMVIILFAGVKLKKESDYTTYVFEGESIQPRGQVPHTIKFTGDGAGGTVLGLTNIKFTPIDTIPLQLKEMQSDYFSISDSTGELARRDNKTGKWIIRNCRRALEIVYQLDSIRNTQPPTREEPESKTEIFLHSSNK